MTDASADLDALTARLGHELHAQEDAGQLKGKLIEIAVHYGPAILEAALRLACRLGGVPIPAPI